MPNDKTLPISLHKTNPPFTSLGHLWSAKGTTGAGWEGYVGCEGLHEHHLYSRTNFKLNRAAALAEWRQLLSA